MKTKPRGERGHYVRVGITLDPAMIYALKLLSAQLHAKGQKDYDMSSLARQAFNDLLDKYNPF